MGGGIFVYANCDACNK